MSRERQRVELAPTGLLIPNQDQEIIVIPAEPPDAIRVVPWYLALIVYPARSDSQDRKEFAKALHSVRCKNVRQYINCWKRLPTEIRSMTNRSIEGKLNMGLRRFMQRRLEAGSIALSLYLKDRPVPGFNPTTRDGMGVVMGGVRVWNSVSKYNGGVSTVTEALKEILRQKMKATGKCYDRNESGVLERDAIENARTYIWNDSRLVLHHCVALYVWLSGVPAGHLTARCPECHRLHPSGSAVTENIYLLLHDPCGQRNPHGRNLLRDLLCYAEDWRVLLDRHGILDKNEATRLIPAD